MQLRGTVAAASRRRGGASVVVGTKVSAASRLRRCCHRPCSLRRCFPPPGPTNHHAIIERWKEQTHENRRERTAGCFVAELIFRQFRQKVASEGRGWLYNKTKRERWRLENDEPELVDAGLLLLRPSPVLSAPVAPSVAVPPLESILHKRERPGRRWSLGLALGAEPVLGLQTHSSVGGRTRCQRADMTAAVVQKEVSAGWCMT